MKLEEQRLTFRQKASLWERDKKEVKNKFTQKILYYFRANHGEGTLRNVELSHY